MVQILDNPSISSLIGAGLGQGLGSSLDEILQDKLSQIKTRRGLQDLGMPRQQATAVSRLSPQQQQEIIKNFMQQQNTSNLMSMLGLGQQSAGVSPQERTTGTMSSDIDNLEALGASAQADQPQIARNLAQPNVMPNYQKLGMLGALMGDTPQGKALQQQAQFMQKEATKKSEVTAKKQEKIDKETLTAYKDINKDAKNAGENLTRLERQEKLLKGGKLNRPGFARFLDTFGIDFLLTPESQEFKKLSKEYLKNAKDIFGSRLTDADLRAFEKMIPTLMQSDEGKNRIIRNLKLTEKAKLLRKNAMDEIIKENKGIRPSNIESLIEEKAGDSLDKLSREYSLGDIKPIEYDKQIPDDAPYIQRLLDTKTPISEAIAQPVDALLGLVGGAGSKLLNLFKFGL